LLGIASDDNSSFLRGPADAPPLIRAAWRSDHWNSFSENGVDLAAPGAIDDAGDMSPRAGHDFDDDIDRAVTRIVAQHGRLLTFGGDHAITFPVVRAIARATGPLSVLHIDAHPDLYDHYEGNRRSHASPFARIMESGLVKRLVQVGIRTLNPHQRAQAARFGVEIIEMKDWRDDLTPSFDTPVYVSFDMDSLDPAFAPGVSHCEPGGLSTRQALGLIQRLRATVVAADVVEFNPRVEARLTAVVAAKIARELAARLLVAD
jgi:agmatinase